MDYIELIGIAAAVIQVIIGLIPRVAQPASSQSVTIVNSPGTTVTINQDRGEANG